MTKIFIDTVEEGAFITKKVRSNNSNVPGLYFKFPVSVAGDLTERLDPFVHALLFPLMKCGGEFEFQGKVSKSVLDNVVHFMQVWRLWLPDLYKEVVISATEEADDDYRPHNKKMISAFSGGLDAAYIAYNYKKGLAPRSDYDLDKAVMILGGRGETYAVDAA